MYAMKYDPIYPLSPPSIAPHHTHINFISIFMTQVQRELPICAGEYRTIYQSLGSPVVISLIKNDSPCPSNSSLPKATQYE